MEEFDLVILGGGARSTIAAWTFAGEGKRVAVVDRKYIGGACPNIARLPSRNVIHSAKLASCFRRSESEGQATTRLAAAPAAVLETRGHETGLPP